MAIAPREPVRIETRRSRAVRRLRTEYVAGGASLTYGADRRSLPVTIDDVTRDLGADLYERMLNDGQVASCVSVLKSSILEDGLEVLSAVPDQKHPEYRAAMEIRDEACTMLEDLQTSLDDVLWDMLDAIALGNKVAEKIWELRPGRSGRDMLQLRAIKPKPREVVSFVVDQYMNVLGLLADGVNRRRYGTSSSTVLRAEDVLPRRKFCVFTFRPRNNDPRGVSILRPAYDPWWRKRQILPEYLKYLAQFAGPSLLGFTPEDAQVPGATDGLGNPEEEVDDGTAETAENPQEAMVRTLEGFRNGTVAAFPHGSSVTPMEVKGDGVAFRLAIAECDHQIAKAILTQSLATEESAHMARAAAQVHQDVLDTIIRQAKRSVCRMIYFDVLLEWVAYNWGPAYRHLTPRASLGTTEQQDLAQLMSAVAALKRSGYLHDSQLPAIDAKLQLPIRDLSQEDDEAEETEDGEPRDGAEADESSPPADEEDEDENDEQGEDA